MRIYKIIACLYSTLAIAHLYALTAEEVIKMADDGIAQIRKSNGDAATLKLNLNTTLNTIKSEEYQAKNYLKQKNMAQEQIDKIKTAIKSAQDDLFKKIKDVPALPAVVASAIKPFTDNYNSSMSKIDAMMVSLEKLLNTALKNVEVIKTNLDKSVNTTIPTIIQKGDETISKLEELKQRAPAIAGYITGVTEQVKI